MKEKLCLVLPALCVATRGQLLVVNGSLTVICRGRFPRLFNHHQPAQVCTFQPSLRTDAASDSEFLLALASGFTKQRRPGSSSLALTLPRSCCLFLFLHPFRIVLAQLVKLNILSATEKTEMADVQQMKKIVPFVTCEIVFGQHVYELMFGVDVFNLNFWIQNNPIRQLIQSNSVGS